MRVPVSVLVVVALGFAGCTGSEADPIATESGSAVAASIFSEGGIASPTMTEEGCRQTPGCWDGEGNQDPSPEGPGYWLPTYEPASCLSVTGAGINDADRDGIDERCEKRLAEVFRPSLSLAPANYDCDPSCSRTGLQSGFRTKLRSESST